MKSIMLTILVFSLNSLAVDAQEKTFFRYKNDQGIQVMSDAIPVTYASKGYQIVNIYGRVVKEVPPELTPEEKIRVHSEQKEKQRLERWDEELTSRYSHIEDIESAKKRKLQEVSTSIFTLKLTLSNTADKIKALQAQAAAVERQGNKIPDDILSSIKQLKQDNTLIEEEILQHQQNKLDIALKHEKDIQRFRIIQGN